MDSPWSLLVVYHLFTFYYCLSSMAWVVLFSFEDLSYLNHLQVTGVGINTEWGLLMASISEDNGEETPLQVHVIYLFIVHSKLIHL